MAQQTSPSGSRNDTVRASSLKTLMPLLALGAWAILPAYIIGFIQTTNQGYFALFIVGVALAVVLSIALFLERKNRQIAASWIVTQSIVFVVVGVNFFIEGMGAVLGTIAFIIAANIGVQTMPRRHAVFSIFISFLGSLGAYLADQTSPVSDRLQISLLLQQTFIVAGGIAILILTINLVKYFSFRHLRNQIIIAFLIVAIIPLFTVVIPQLIGVQENTNTIVNTTLSTNAKTLGTSIDNRINNLKTQVEIGANTPDIRAFLDGEEDEREEALGTLIAIGSGSEYTLSIGLLDMQGNVVLDSRSLNLGQSEALKGWFIQPLINRGPYVSEATYDDTQSLMTLYVGTPVFNENDQMIGILRGQYNAEFLQEELGRQSSSLGEDYTAILTDANGVILAHNTAPLLRFKTLSALTPERHSVLQTVGQLPPGDMKTLSSGLDEIGEFVKTIQDTPVSQARLEAGNPSEFSVAGYVLFNNNWKVIVGIPVQTFASTLVNQTRNTVIIGLVIVLAVVFAASITANLLTSPLNELAQITAEIGRGNLEVSAKSDRLDEIGILSNVFDQTSTELRLVLSDLERRVAEQTSELAASNKTNARRAEQLRSIAEIAQSVTGLQDIETLLPQITDKISKVLGFYHVGIFLLDPNKQFAVLRAANSEGGKKMLAREHKLKVGQVGIVGFVTSTGQSRIALDVGEDAVFFNNPDLPLTRSEIALPFKIGEEIIGALDVQSTESNAFSAQDVDILSLLADQVSIAIQNSRLFEETRRALAEAQLLYSESLSSSWKAFASEENLNFRYTNGKVEILGTQKAAKMDGKTSALEMDIAIRGKTLGKLHIEVPDKNRKWTDGEMRLYRAIVERLAFTLENARLFRDARKLASKEQLIGEITSKIGASVNMDNILQTAVEQLSMAIPDSEIIIQFREEENKLES